MITKNDLSDNEWKEIGNRIKRRRKSCGFRQQDLAEQVGISLTHMSSIENGKQHPSVYVLLTLCEKLNTTPDYFLIGNIRPHNVPQNIIDILNTCDDSTLQLIKSLINCVIEHTDKSD